jgi:hypothetical protein
VCIYGHIDVQPADKVRSKSSFLLLHTVK